MRSIPLSEDGLRLCTVFDFELDEKTGEEGSANSDHFSPNVMTKVILQQVASRHA
jgi:hypothetical protein